MDLATKASFVDKLTAFTHEQRDCLTNVRMKKVAAVTQKAEFSLKLMEEESSSCRFISEWVLAVENYCKARERMKEKLI